MIEVAAFVDWFLFGWAGLSVAYLIFFAFLALRRSSVAYPRSGRKSRILVLFPAYKADRVIEGSIRSLLDQDYPKEMYHTVVISDQMEPVTLQRLAGYPVEVLPIVNNARTKARALQLAVERLEPDSFDTVVVLDADNTVLPDFLSRINDARQSGLQAMQGQRVAKNRDTAVAVLDAASEAMNHAFFRKGQVRLGFSAALSGSGMAFNFRWFKENIGQVTTAGEDKELEALLIRQGLFIDYLEDLLIFDEKTADSASFSRQRRRWLAAQYGILKKGVKDLPEALSNGNWDYCNKLFQWMMLPRVLLLEMIFIISLVLSLLCWQWSLKWWLLLIGLGISFSAAIPDEMVDKRLKRALIKVPHLFVLMGINLFRMKGANRTFIHTRQHDN